MPASDFVLLDYEFTLMIFMRTMEVLSVVILIFTIRIIQLYNGNSLGMYKYYLYQIVAWSFVSHMCTILGPVFVLPIIGAYHYIDFTDNPAVTHGILCTWIMICAFDIQSILDGFNYRLRVLLLSYYPRLAYKPFWISATISSKLSVVIMVLCLLAPYGKRLNRIEMRSYLLKEYPNAIEKFDNYKSFVVYDIGRLDGFREVMSLLALGVIVMAFYGILLDIAPSPKSDEHFNSKIAPPFVKQLSFQASVPFVVLLCPLIALLSLTVFEFDFQNNFPGYGLTAFMILHGPLTSIMTIALNSRYRQAVATIFNERFLCRRSNPSSFHVSVRPEYYARRMTITHVASPTRKYP